MGNSLQLYSCKSLASLCLSSVLWIGCLEAGAREVPDNRDVRAAGVLGSSDVALLSLIRELSAWKERALRAEDLLSKAGVSPSLASGAIGGSVAESATKVLSSIEEERVLVLSFGKDRGVLQGALVAVGRDVVAKVIESRETISAAIVDSSYKGKLVTLEGLPVKLAVR